MSRHLRMSPRPLIVFGSMALLFVALWLLPALFAGQVPAEYAPPLVMVGLFSAIGALVYSTRVMVTEEGLTVWRWFILKQEIPFEDISHSDVQYLAEADWPIMLKIYGRGRPALLGRIGLKAIRKEDAAWLCSLPQLKPVLHMGLVK